MSVTVNAHEAKTYLSRLLKRVGNGRVTVKMLISTFLLLIPITVSSLEFSVQYFPGDKFKITEKSNLRRYKNGRFIGLSYREVRCILDVRAGGDNMPVKDAAQVQGNFYVFEETKHDKRHVAKKIDDVVTVKFFLKPNGDYIVPESERYPTLRSFPTFPAEPVEQDGTWRAYGVRVVEPFRDGVFTRVRFYCEYRYLGRQRRNGRVYEVIKAQYAVRYKQGEDPYGDERIKRLSGKHVVTIYYDPGLEKPSFMSDQMEENYQLEDNQSIGFKGFILTWFDNIAVMNRTRLAEEVRRTLDESEVEDVTVEEKGGGVALTLNKIHFVPDQAVVLPDERPRLNALADTLKKIEERSFLVVGHTARVGTEESQYELSVQRAKAIIDYLVSQGLKAERFIYEGKGGTDPVAPNDTEENRAKNRRVEIIILED